MVQSRDYKKKKYYYNTKKYANQRQKDIFPEVENLRKILKTTDRQPMEEPVQRSDILYNRQNSQPNDMPVKYINSENELGEIGLPDGFCYITWFITLRNYGYLFDVCQVARVFGEYPLGRQVCAFLASILKDDVILPKPIFVNFFMTHVQKNHDYVKFSEIMKFYLFSDVRVGSDNEDDAAMDGYLAHASRVETLRSVAESAGRQFDGVVADCASAVLRNTMREDTGLARDVILGSITNKYSKKNAMRLSFALSSSQLSALQSDFPSLGVVTSGTDQHPHGFAAAHRVCSEAFVLKEIKYKLDRSVDPAEYDKYLIDVGANPVRHARAGRLINTHVCVPIIDFRDSARETERRLQLSTYVADGVITADTANLVLNEGTARCMYKAGSGRCHVRAPYGLFLHSSYDVDEDAFLDALDSHQFAVVWVVMHFDTRVFYKTEFFMDTLGAYVKIKDGYISFVFAGDSALGYKHKFSTYMQFLTRRTYVTSTGRCYLAENVYHKSGTIFIKFTHCVAKPETDMLHLNYSYSNLNPNDNIVVATWKYNDGSFLDSTFKMKGKSIRFERHYLEVSRSLFDTILSHCLRSGDKSFNINEIFSAAVSYNSRMTINGMDILQGERMPSLELMHLVVAIFCISYQRRYESGKVVEAFVNAEKQKRASERLGFLDVVDYIFDGKFDGVLSPIKEWWNNFVKKIGDHVDNKRVFSVLIADSVKKFELEEFVEVIANTNPIDTRFGDRLINLRTKRVECLWDEAGNIKTIEEIISAAFKDEERSIHDGDELYEEENGKKKPSQSVEKLYDLKPNNSKSPISQNKPISQLLISQTKQVSADDIHFPASDTRIRMKIDNEQFANDDCASGVSIKSVSKRKQKRAIDSFHSAITGSSRESNPDCHRAVRNDALTCDCPLTRVISQPGDGQCLFHTLKAHFPIMSALGIADFRRFIHSCAVSKSEKDNAAYLLNMREIGRSETVTLLSAMFRVTMCTHADHSVVEKVNGRREFKRIRYVTTVYSDTSAPNDGTIHLAWRISGNDGHVDAIVPADGAIPNFDKNFVNVFDRVQSVTTDTNIWRYRTLAFSAVFSIVGSVNWVHLPPVLRELTTIIDPDGGKSRYLGAVYHSFKEFEVCEYKHVTVSVFRLDSFFDMDYSVLRRFRECFVVPDWTTHTRGPGVFVVCVHYNENHDERWSRPVLFAQWVRVWTQFSEHADTLTDEYVGEILTNAIKVNMCRVRGGGSVIDNVRAIAEDLGYGSTWYAAFRLRVDKELKRAFNARHYDEVELAEILRRFSNIQLTTSSPATYDDNTLSWLQKIVNKIRGIGPLTNVKPSHEPLKVKVRDESLLIKTYGVSGKVNMAFEGVPVVNGDQVKLNKSSLPINIIHASVERTWKRSMGVNCTSAGVIVSPGDNEYSLKKTNRGVEIAVQCDLSEKPEIELDNHVDRVSDLIDLASTISDTDTFVSGTNTQYTASEVTIYDARRPSFEENNDITLNDDVLSTDQDSVTYYPFHVSVTDTNRKADYNYPQNVDTWTVSSMSSGARSECNSASADSFKCESALIALRETSDSGGSSVVSIVERPVISSIRFDELVDELRSESGGSSLQMESPLMVDIDRASEVNTLSDDSSLVSVSFSDCSATETHNVACGEISVEMECDRESLVSADAMSTDEMRLLSGRKSIVVKKEKISRPGLLQRLFKPVAKETPVVENADCVDSIEKILAGAPGRYRYSDNENIVMTNHWYAFPNNCGISISFMSMYKNKYYLGSCMRHSLKLGQGVSKKYFADWKTSKVADYDIRYKCIKGGSLFIIFEQVKLEFCALRELFRIAATLCISEGPRFAIDMTDSDVVTFASLIHDFPSIRMMIFNDGNSKFNVLASKPKHVEPTLGKDVFPHLNDADLGMRRAPDYYGGTDMLCNYRNAFIEFRHVIAGADNVNAIEFKKVWDMTVGHRAMVGCDAYLKKHDMLLFDNVRKKYLFRDARTEYMGGYSNGHYVRWLEDDLCFDTKEDYVLVSRSTKVMINTMITSILADVSHITMQIPLIDWVNGVPGCGKTEYVIRNHAVAQDLVLTSTTEGIRDIRKRVMAVHRLRLHEDRIYYRTISSVLANGVKQSFNRVVVDEALMVHAGSLAAICELTGCKKLMVLGDVNQIPYIDRDHVCTQRYAKLSEFASVTSELNTTYRCPMDVCYALKGYYSSMATKNPVVMSMKILRYSGSGGIPNLVNTLYMTHCQSDKEVLQHQGYGTMTNSKVLTIHEAQGLAFDNVILVRYQTKDLPVYRSVGHAIVAISRHKKTFTYYVDVDDIITGIVRSTIGAGEGAVVENNRRNSRTNDGKVSNPTDCDSRLIKTAIESRALSKHRVGGKYCYIPPEYHCRANVHVEELDALKNLPSWSHMPKVPRIMHSAVSMEYPRHNIRMRFDSDVDFLQSYYDDKVAGASVNTYDYDQTIVEYSDINVAVDRITIEQSRRVYSVSKFDKLKPLLRTMMASNRRPSPRESILGLAKRNLNAPKLHNDMSPSVLGEFLFKNFMKGAIRSGAEHIMDAYRDDVIHLHHGVVAEWLLTQKPQVASLVVSTDPLHERRFNSFGFMVKPQVKPSMDPASAFKYASVQTIAYSSKDVNVIFCPIFNVMRDRLYAVLHDNLMVFTGMSPSDFVDEVNKRINISELKYSQIVEMDMSKYDKAQGLALLTFECKLYEALGMHPDLVDVWFESHKKSFIRDRLHGVRVTTNYQRKSGDASTFFGNTMVLLAVVLAAYHIDDIDLGLFAGDDSVLWVSKAREDPSRMMADMFNLECKLLTSYTVPYFCSKFIIVSNNVFYMVPDLLKVITKLGRRDMSNYDHVEEYRVSCLDAISPLMNLEITYYLSIGIHERYGGLIFDCEKAIRILNRLVSNPYRFKQLFIEVPNSRLCHDVSRSNI